MPAVSASVTRTGTGKPNDRLALVPDAHRVGSTVESLSLNAFNSSRPESPDVGDLRDWPAFGFYGQVVKGGRDALPPCLTASGCARVSVSLTHQQRAGEERFVHPFTAASPDGMGCSCCTRAGGQGVVPGNGTPAREPLFNPVEC